MTTEELIGKLKRCQSYARVDQLVVEADSPEGGWTDRSVESIERVCIEVFRNPQALRAVTLYGSNWKHVKRFFRALGQQVETECGTDDMPPYTREIMERAYLLSTRLIYDTITEKQSQEAEREPEVFEGLYHANSVSTSLAFIEEGGLFTRDYGERLLGHFRQTPQASDEIDKKFNIYNDVFFDNCHIAKWVDRYSFYGPVTFVYDPKVLLAHKTVRVARLNPWRGAKAVWEELSYRERIYTDVTEFGNAFSLTDFRAHTMIYHPEGGIVPFCSADEVFLKKILVERHPQDAGLTEEIVGVLRDRLYRDERLRRVPVADIAVNNAGAVLNQELWDIPENARLGG